MTKNIRTLTKFAILPTKLTTGDWIFLKLYKEDQIYEFDCLESVHYWTSCYSWQKVRTYQNNS